jgi:hypothetical protein
MKLKVGVMGSASGKLSKTHRKVAFEMGCAIAENDCITITGACPGLPLEAAKGASKTGAKVMYESNPRVLLKNLIDYYLKKHYKHPDIHS